MKSNEIFDALFNRIRLHEIETKEQQDEIKKIVIELTRSIINGKARLLTKKDSRTKEIRFQDEMCLVSIQFTKFRK